MPGRTLLAAVFVGLALAPAASAAGTPDCADRALIPGADLRRCDLRPYALAGLDLTGADLRRATFPRVLDPGPDGPSTLLIGARLQRADMRGVIFGFTVLTYADLSRTDLRGADFEDTVLFGARLHRADLRTARLGFSGLGGADLRHADLRDASLRYAYANDFGGVPTDLRHADLTGADLTGADLRGALFDHAELAGVVWADTTCPDGTNSDTDGGTCLGHL